MGRGVFGWMVLEANWAWNRVETSCGSPHQTLNPIPGPSSLTEAAQFCANEIAGMDLSNPMEVAGAQDSMSV